MKKFLAGFVLLAVLLVMASAHKPRLVGDSASVDVQNPAVSQAFYGTFSGAPAYYNIESDKPFLLYVGVLVPDLRSVPRDVSAEVYSCVGGKVELLASLDGGGNWTYFWEEFAGDGYYQGPEFNSTVGAGAYVVKVFRPGNEGKYAVAIGTEEQFGLEDTLNSVVVLPQLKVFFEKSPFTAFLNTIGLFLALQVLAALAVVAIAFFGYKRLAGKRPLKKPGRKRV
ncbi:MAG: hypothetical protein NTY90_05645 [Candidatus Micrarchaeota archaeon]|nr:hypothetical protein [Candidatus Micrarchaeota archaeon]